jgi:AcrR family transcriptional regulator
MEKTRRSGWIETGYRLFAEEGLEGIQVERLARIVGLNKSGFYHYFGDLERFCSELIEHHFDKVTLFIQDVRLAKNLDPEYLQLVIRHATTVMFQVQLTRNKTQHSFYEASQVVDQRVNPEVHRIWSEFLGDYNHSHVALRYYFIIRDMFYTRISFENLNYQYLHGLAEEAKSVMTQMRKGLVAPVLVKMDTR